MELMLILSRKIYLHSQIPKLWCPDTIKTPDGKTHHFPIPDIGDTNYTNCGGFQYEAKAVRECLLKGNSTGLYNFNINIVLIRNL